MKLVRSLTGKGCSSYIVKRKHFCPGFKNVYLYIHTYVDIHISTCICIYIYIFIYIYIYIFIYIFIYIQFCDEYIYVFFTEAIEPSTFSSSLKLVNITPVFIKDSKAKKRI